MPKLLNVVGSSGTDHHTTTCLQVQGAIRSFYLKIMEHKKSSPPWPTTFVVSQGRLQAQSRHIRRTTSLLQGLTRMRVTRHCRGRRAPATTGLVGARRAKRMAARWSIAAENPFRAQSACSHKHLAATPPHRAFSQSTVLAAALVPPQERRDVQLVAVHELGNLKLYVRTRGGLLLIFASCIA